MTTIAVTMVHNEADIIETVLRHTAQQVDRIIVADNLSTDDTPDILARLADELPLTVVPDDEPGYFQARKMTALLRQAQADGATWVLPFDADECWYTPHGPRIVDVLAALPADIDTIYAQGWDHIGPGLSPWRRQEIQRLPKVALRPSEGRTLTMGNHDAPGGQKAAQGVLEFRHFQYRSLEQMVAKLRHGAEAYKLTDLPETEGAHWREGGVQQGAELVRRWDMLVNEPGLVYDPAPWDTQSPADVSIVIPTWNRASLLADCLRALDATAPEAQVIVVDNGSDDGTADVCAGFGPDVIRNDANLGFAKASNQGAEKARGDLLVFLNNDTIPQPGWLQAMLRAPQAIVGANLTRPDGSQQHTGVFFRRSGDTLEAYERNTPAESGRVPAVTGACLMVPAVTFANLGGWDEGYRNGYEDVDLCLTAWGAGVPIWYAADAHVMHHESMTDGRFDHAQANVARLQERWGHLPI